MPHPKLSVVLATYNEEQNLARCLDSVRSLADEIVIVDGKSTDKTPQIAKNYKAKLISTTNKSNFHINKNMAIEAAAGEWILQLDADEVVSPMLANEIKSVLDNPSDINGYWINRKNWFLTRFLSKGGQYPDPTLRLYRNGTGRLPAKDVHEQTVVSGKVGALNNDLLHYRDTDFSKYLDGFNRYSSFIASQMTDRNEAIGLIPTINNLIIKPLNTFLNLFIRHRGYIDGFPGFVFAIFSGLVLGVSYIKYWQQTKYPA